MSVSRLNHITRIGVEQMGDLADSLDDPEVLRLENLDTNIPPPKSAIAFTRDAIVDDDANSYLPFLGMDSIRQAATTLVATQSGNEYEWKTDSVISAGGLSGVLNVLLATLEPGDEVLLTDPTYVGLINRVRLAGGVPRFVPLMPTATGWVLDRDALVAIDRRAVRAMLLMSPSMPAGAGSSPAPRNFRCLGAGFYRSASGLTRSMPTDRVTIRAGRRTAGLPSGTASGSNPLRLATSSARP